MMWLEDSCPIRWWRMGGNELGAGHFLYHNEIHDRLANLPTKQSSDHSLPFSCSFG